MAVENSAKALITIHAVPSWSHDPSPELLSIKEKFSSALQHDVERLADLTETLAPEHARASYGDPLRGISPWELYRREYAERAVKVAREATNIMKRLLKHATLA